MKYYRYLGDCGIKGYSRQTFPDKGYDCRSDNSYRVRNICIARVYECFILLDTHFLYEI